MGRQTFDTKTRAQRIAAGAKTTRQHLPGRTVYRRRRKAVSLWRHAFGALTVLLAIALAIATYVELYGDANDAIPRQEVSLAPLPQSAASDTLYGNGEGLPDLLGASVAEGANPTEAIAHEQSTTQKLDALGNPITGTNQPLSNDVLVGEIATEHSKTTTSQITINGQAIGGDLIKAPVQGLTRTSPYGLVPTKAEDGRTAYSVYARPYTARAGEKTVSLIIGGLGINRTLTQRAINELPAEVTLSFAAHAPNLQNQVNAARAKGHEILLELPMESEEFDPTEPGSDHALRVGSPTATQNMRNLDWLLSQASGYFAVTNYNGSLFLQRSDSVVPVLTVLSDAGVGFVFDGSSPAPSLATLASVSKLPYQKAYSLIDENPDVNSIRTELDKLSTLAKGGAAPVSVGFTYPQTIDAVNDWVRTLKADGLTLAPASSRMQTH